MSTSTRLQESKKQELASEGKVSGGKESMSTMSGGGNAEPLVRLVKSEHEEIANLWQQFQRATTHDEKHAIVKNHLLPKLAMHSGKEEIALYPALRTALDNGDQEVEKQKSEHQQMTEDCYKVETMDCCKSPAEMDALIQKIMGEFNQHISDEENRLLPLFSSKVSKEEGEKVLDKYKSATVTTHAHPSAPREGLAAQAAHVASIPIDAVKDAMKK